SGVAHFVARDDAECLAMIRELLSFVPSNNLEDPPRRASADAWDRADRSLDALVPADPMQPYDIKDVIHAVTDDNYFFELHEHFAKNLVVGFARFDGRPVGIVANQPAVRAGVLDINASAMRSIFPWSPSRTCPVFCPARSRSSAASLSTARSCSMPSPKPPSRKSRSSRARPTAAPTASCPASISAPTRITPGPLLKSR